MDSPLIKFALTQRRGGWTVTLQGSHCGACGGAEQVLPPDMSAKGGLVSTA
ncbi:hypothetical protein [Rhodopirellula sallentina]|uniref:hypothetical protein n=1 Tax=Rhodopirellula sallentina TaxID=1263869 RepID=UPI001360B0DF|nr:hypothetical protein [Rhodopirellula sallentina]